MTNPPRVSLALSGAWATVRRPRLLALVLVLAALAVTSCGGGETLTVYSGRNRNLVDPIIERFAEEHDVKVAVRYGSTSGITATLLEEGDNTPADVVFLQDAGALGALTEEGVLLRLDDDLLGRVDRQFRSADGRWVGVSGRARVVVYNTEAVDPRKDLPASVLGFTDPKWKGRIGWAPTNGSFQAFVTGLRLQLGEAAARAWLEGIMANDPVDYSNNTSTVQATANGEVEVGFVNHYYLHRFLEERGEDFGARNYYLLGGDAGGMINVAGVGVVRFSDDQDLAAKFVDFLLGTEAQRYFADETFEFPLVDGVPSASEVPPLDSLDPPNLDLSRLADLRGTLDLLREVGALN